MKTETFEYHGYRIEIHYDTSPENPFTAWDCEPPLLAYYDSGRHGFKAYNDAPKTWRDILSLLPESVFERGQRVPFIRRFLNQSPRDFARSYLADFGNMKDAFAACLEDEMEAKPHGWSNAIEWLKTAAAILEYGGISCHFTQSNGYSQGDSTFLLAVATQEWRDKAGFTPGEPLPTGCLESACELHGFWQWGDVYGVASITDEKGDEIPDGSCWGFYGSDHEKSGLLDHARNAIECHERAQEKEALHLSAALAIL